MHSHNTLKFAGISKYPSRNNEIQLYIKIDLNKIVKTRWLLIQRNGDEKIFQLSDDEIRNKLSLRFFNFTHLDAVVMKFLTSQKLVRFIVLIVW